MRNKNLLIAIYQNTKMATQSINDMYPKFRCSDLKQLMKKQESGYLEICKECEELAKLKNIKLKDNNLFEKTILWTSINISTLTNKSACHIAELFLIGTVRGTLSLYQDLRTHKNIDEDVKKLAEKLINIEEEYFNEIKKYLKE